MNNLIDTRNLGKDMTINGLTVRDWDLLADGKAELVIDENGNKSVVKIESKKPKCQVYLDTAMSYGGIPPEESYFFLEQTTPESILVLAEEALRCEDALEQLAATVGNKLVVRNFPETMIAIATTAPEEPLAYDESSESIVIDHDNWFDDGHEDLDQPVDKSPKRRHSETRYTASKEYRVTFRKRYSRDEEFGQIYTYNFVTAKWLEEMTMHPWMYKVISVVEAPQFQVFVSNKAPSCKARFTARHPGFLKAHPELQDATVWELEAARKRDLADVRARRKLRKGAEWVRYAEGTETNDMFAPEPYHMPIDMEDAELEALMDHGFSYKEARELMREANSPATTQFDDQDNWEEYLWQKECEEMDILLMDDHDPHDEMVRYDSYDPFDDLDDDFDLCDDGYDPYYDEPLHFSSDRSYEARTEVQRIEEALEALKSGALWFVRDDIAHYLQCDREIDGLLVRAELIENPPSYLLTRIRRVKNSIRMTINEIKAETESDDAFIAEIKHRFTVREIAKDRKRWARSQYRHSYGKGDDKTKCWRGPQRFRHKPGRQGVLIQRARRRPLAA